MWARDVCPKQTVPLYCPIRLKSGRRVTYTGKQGECGQRKMRVTSIYFIAFFASFTAYAWNYAKTQRPALRLSSLRMGRAAAVRANTKAKTDAAKSKNNGIYGMCVILKVVFHSPDSLFFLHHSKKDHNGDKSWRWTRS